MACKQYALGACGLQVVEAHLGAAGEFTVIFSPVDEHPLALYSCRFVGAEGVAGVAVFSEIAVSSPVNSLVPACAQG